MLFGSLIRWLFSRYIEWHVCRQFCAFKKAGSTLRYTHVHLLTENDAKATGLGHDDETNTDDEGHAAVSDKNGTRTQAESDESRRLREFTWITAYFHQGGADGGCEEGFKRVKCKCAAAEGPEEGQSGDVWVCYTLDHKTFMGWYEGTSWENRVGRYGYPYTGVGQDATTFPPQTVRCGSSVVLRNVEFRRAANCVGFGGPGDGENPLIQTARARLQQAYDRIACEGNCVKSKVETFRGWKCGITRDGLMAEAAVQWTVTCKKQ